MGKPPVRDGRRSCLNADGKPKKSFDNMEEAETFALKHHAPGKKEPYKCNLCGQIHIGSSQRRMIFPDKEHPCGTPGCLWLTPHMPTECTIKT